MRVRKNIKFYSELTYQDDIIKLDTETLRSYVKDASILAKTRKSIYERQREEYMTSHGYTTFPEALAYSKSSPIHKTLEIIDKKGVENLNQEQLRHFLSNISKFFTRSTGKFSGWAKQFEGLQSTLRSEIGRDLTPEQQKHMFELYSNFQKNESAYGGKYELWRKISELQERIDYSKLTNEEFSRVLEDLDKLNDIGKMPSQDVMEILYQNDYFVEVLRQVDRSDLRPWETDMLDNAIEDGTDREEQFDAYQYFSYRGQQKGKKL